MGADIRRCIIAGLLWVVTFVVLVELGRVWP